jgi:hypothetical protein
MESSKRRVRSGARLGAVAAALLVAVPAWTQAGDAAPADAALRLDADLLLNAVRQRVADCAGGQRTLAHADAGRAARGAAPAAATASDATALVERPLLRWNARLAAAAGTHALSMARTRLFDHVGADGRTVRDRVEATGYRWRVVGENLAAGQGTLADAIADWLASRSHCEALLDTRFTEFGIARAAARRRDDAYGTYWTLVLGRPY